MNKTNSDGSVRLGTLRLETLLALALAQGIDCPLTKDAIESARADIKAAAMAELDGKVNVALNPNEAVSDVNTEHPFKLDQVVVYLKRDNPTGSTISKKELKAQKVKELSDKVQAGELSVSEFLAQIAQIV